MTVQDLIVENHRRMQEMYSGFNPLTGEGAPLERQWLHIPDFTIPKQFVPLDMLKNKLIRLIIEAGTLQKFIENELDQEYTPETKDRLIKELCLIRSRCDFCFWAYMFVKIKPKAGGDMIRFRLRHEQRILLTELEKMRFAGLPIRIILLKARQWGGSTLVQIYMAWIQLMHKTGWYSNIVAQTLSTSRTIKAMYSKLLENYPSWLLDIPNQQLEFSPYEGSSSASIITYGKATNKTIARDTVINIATYENPNATRGTDNALIHYSEVAIWSETLGKKPEDLIRSISGGLLEVPLTMEVMESTANGTGNYFHREWERAKRGESNRTPVFIPWYFIEQDSIPVQNENDFASWLLENKNNDANPEGFLDPGKYYWYLWEQGATFAGINWYRTKRKGFADHADMASEAPSNDIEAFKHSGKRVFDIYRIEDLKKNTRPPRFIGDIQGQATIGKKALLQLKFKQDKQGILQIWELPETDIQVRHRYLVTVDVGGRSRGSDYSVISVIDRFPMLLGGKPEIVAQWRGHIDHDLLAWKAAQIAQFYGKALLVIESNTLETKDKERDTDGDHTEFILNQIADVYDNLYARSNSETDIREGKPRKWGFHTNTATKPLIIDHLVTCVRNAAWIERDINATDELGFYEKKDNGSYGAISGQHDDILMTRAIGLYICYREMELPKIIENKTKKRTNNKPLTAAVI